MVVVAGVDVGGEPVGDGARLVTKVVLLDAGIVDEEDVILGV